MSDEITTQKVRDMAKLVHLSGRISEFHEKNLKQYAFIFFDGVKEASIEYDFSHRPSNDGPKETPKNTQDFYKEIGRAALSMKSDAFVAYKLVIIDDQVHDHMDKRYEALEKSVRSLFWNEVVVKVYINGNIAYESKK